MNYFGVEAGEAHESAGEAYEAIASYKLAAQRAMAPAAPGTVVVPPEAQSFVWNCLGLALKRHGQLEMATRAYLWSLAVQGHLDADRYRECIKSLLNAISLTQATPAERENRRQHDARAIERQRDTVVQASKAGADGGKIFAVIACAHCSTRRDRTALKTCARCGIARYCDRACQQADWQSHKASCKAGKAAGVEAVP
jgi:Flp pilus assembly protein TadD